VRRTTSDLEEREDAARFGDESTSLTYAIDYSEGPPVEAIEVVIRAGAQVGVVSIFVIDPETLDPVEAFAEAAEACLEAPSERCEPIDASGDAFFEAGDNEDDSDDQTHPSP
jgi:hypothetical protein